jgi:23S rRNA-/tRNA-specific pseudouridylate synthase
MYQIKDLSGINGEIRPGIVHRIDKDTSGLLMVPCTKAVYLRFTVLSISCSTRPRCAISFLATISKPDVVVHPSPGHYTGTLVNGLMYQIKDLSGINGEIRHKQWLHLHLHNKYLN